jgi:cytochrome c oxidase cbb3-type subunit 2
MDALVAYLQVLGTMVDFSKYSDDAFVDNRRTSQSRAETWNG